QEEKAAQIHFREAGAAYEATAQGTPSQPEQGEWWWRAASCYLQGQDFAPAKNAMQTLTQLRPPTPRLGEVWYRLAEAQQALHDDAAATGSYKHCIETGGPFAFRAQYQLALAETRRGR